MGILTLCFLPLPSTLQVFTQAMQACIAELQRHLLVSPELSPAWIQAAERLYAPRLDTLLQLLRLQPHIVRMLPQEWSKDPPEMVRPPLLCDMPLCPCVRTV